MNAETKDWRTLPAGRELDALVAERVMGGSLTPPRELAMARVGWRYISSTGREFTLTTGERLTMPPGRTLPSPEGSTDWNDRYALFVAQHLGERIAAEVEAERFTAQPYSTDIAAAWLVVEKMRKGDVARSWTFDIVDNSEHGGPEEWLARFLGYDSALDSPFGPVGYEREDTAPLAICRAALAAVESQP